MKKVCHEDLIEKYENPISHPCDLKIGQVFISENAEIPKGFCQSAWNNLYPFVLTLSCDGEDIFDGWMKNKKSAMISCNDGFRPVSFLLETIN